MKKIAIIVFNYWLSSSLSLTSCTTLLAREGYDVHIFIDDFIYKRSKAEFEEANIRVHPVKIGGDPREDTTWWDAFVANKAAQRQDEKLSGLGSALLDVGSALNYLTLLAKSKTTLAIQSIHYAFIAPFIARAVATPSTKTIKKYTRRFFPHIVEFYEKIANQIDEDFVCLIGVEPFGLIAATLAADASTKGKSVPVIYYDQELLLEKECHTAESRILKILERMCNRMCRFTIIQDERRAAYLRDDNNLEAESIVCVPVSGLGKAYRAKGNLLQEMCGIPQEKKVLLYAGYMAPWAMCLEMAEAAQNWRDDFVLVLHSWQEDIVRHPYITQIRRLTQTRKVYLSLKQVDWQKMPELVSSADIGLAFYQNLGENFREIGHSSNKLAQYLQMGLPVITTDYPSMRDVIDRYQCGACGSGPDSIEPLAEMIFNDYERYRANAFRCYENDYDFSKHFRKVIERIKQIEASSR
jgi:glycosyltransferase involved in cell wall biosynthesis